ncbi:MAG TPA: class I SAM-dependent methyltransferase [Candidatus Bathyarchaeia archaeon]|jgi:tocopherol O-methyltransferase|nr:class I SAM-dependent methyltransferase [Candidatus Bathyarchaeia archaeon]
MATMTRANDKEKVREHYDRMSPYYHSLWGEHIHHGYWIRGNESKETAQVQLIEHLAQAAGIPQGAKVLDVGCGFGASSIYLVRKYGAEATGITISPVQVEMANQAAAKAGVNAKFLLMDAEAMTFEEPFDVVWSVESISHYQDIPKFLGAAAALLRPGGTLAITDWFKKKGLTAREHEKFLGDLEHGMMVELQTMEDYAGHIAATGLEVTRSEVLNKNCAKTWDFCLDIIKDKALWAAAVQNGSDFVRFLRAFKDMRAGFASGNFVYGLMLAKARG